MTEAFVSVILIRKLHLMDQQADSQLGLVLSFCLVWSSGDTLHQ